MKSKNEPKEKNRVNGQATELGIKPISVLNRPRSWAIYGRSGSGKTTFAASFPKPILLIDIRDQGTDSIADHEDIDVVEIESWEQLEEVYYYLRDNPKKYKTVVVDTITQLQQLCLEDAIGAKTKDKSRVGDWGSMTRRDWGTVSGLMKDWIVNLRNLPLEVVFLAQEKVTTVDDDADDNPDNMITPEVGAHVMPSVRVVLNANVSVIGNTFIRLRRFKKEVKGKKISKEETRYCLRIGPNPVYDTKIRKPKSVPPPAFIEDPTFKDVVDIIKGE